MFMNTVVKSFISSAEQGQTRFRRQLSNQRVIELSSGRTQDDSPRSVPVSVDTGQGCIDHVDPDDHSGPAAVGGVVNPPPL